MRGYVDSRWGQVHYSDTGGGDRTVVLLHETPLNHRAYLRLSPLLARTSRVVAFDTPGYGESDGPLEPTTIEEYAVALADAITDLGLDEVAIYGQHTGASLAFELAARAARDRVSALIMTGLPFYTDEVRAAKVVPAIPTLVEDGSHLLSTFRWEPDAYDAEVRSRLVSGVSRDRSLAYQAFHAVYIYEPAQALAEIRCPVLLISNPRDPLFAADRRVLDAIPNARQVVIDSSRLPVYWLDAPQVASEISGFIGATASSGVR